MIRFACGFLAIVLVAGLSAAQDKPDDIIKKAVKAHGGEAALKKYPAGTSKISGKVVSADLPFTGVMYFSVPGKVRVEMTFKVKDQEATTLQIINGQKVKQVENGKKVDLKDEVADELRESSGIQEMAQLYPLLDKRYSLTAGKDGTYDGKDCSTIVVSAKGLKETTLAFDKDGGLLIAMMRKGVSPTGDLVNERTIFSKFEKIEGMMVPMQSRVFHNDNAFLEMTVTEYKPAEKLDDKLFEIE
jgi:hypothetical protein